MLTYSAANKILSALTGKTTTISLASNCYVGLSQTEPRRDGSSCTEPLASYPGVSGGQVSTGYKRELLGSGSNPASQKMSTPENGSITNKDNIIYLPEVRDISDSTATPEQKAHPWGEVSYFCLFDAETGGNLVAYSPIVEWVEGESGEPGHYEPVTLNPVPGQLPIIRTNQLILEVE